ncbi:MAG: hypothetical protein CMP22_01055 [Rickettsiales bacterium]|nr:hypothetical protein [Rickettsiales bacterium]|tara:strand:+ start:810 stop:1217 length:408 start_codon:yes stop_codon:yes gene_type:complete
MSNRKFTNKYHSFLSRNPKVVAYLNDKFETDEERLAFYKERVDSVCEKTSAFKAFGVSFASASFMGLVSIAIAPSLMMAIPGLAGSVALLFVIPRLMVLSDKEEKYSSAHSKVQEDLRIESGQTVYRNPRITSRC